MQVSGAINIRPVDVTSQQASQTAALPFSGFSEGDTVEAQVTAVSGRQVTLQTSDGMQVTTQFPEGAAVRPGDTVGLTMVDKSQHMVHLRLSTVNGQTVNLESSEMQVYMMEMGVPPSKANEAAAQVFLRYQLTPTSERVANLVNVATTLPDIPTPVAVLMAANNIPPTRENAEIVMKWLADPASLGADVEALGGMVRQEGGAAAEATLTAFQGAVMEKASPEQAALLRSSGFQELSAQLAGRNVSPQEAQTVIHNYVQGLDLTPQDRQAVETLLLEAFQAVRGQADAAGQATAGAGVQTPQQAAAAEAQTPQQAQQAAATVSQAGEPAAQGQSGEAVAAAGADAAAAGSQSAEADAILSNLGRFFARMKGGDVPEDAKTLQEAVRGQQELADTVKTGISRLMGDSSPAAQKAGDLSAQVRLGSQMEQFYYCQIPFETKEQKGTAELYVFERKRGQQETERTNVTVLIGLDTQYMGRVETVLRSEEERLSVEFRVENGKVEAHFAESVQSFSDQMRDNGFPLHDIRIARIREPVTPLNAMQMIEPEQKAKIAGIDIHV